MNSGVSTFAGGEVRVSKGRDSVVNKWRCCRRNQNNGPHIKFREAPRDCAGQKLLNYEVLGNNAFIKMITIRLRV